VATYVHLSLKAVGFEIKGFYHPSNLRSDELSSDGG
jgi:hypothetical protein